MGLPMARIFFPKDTDLNHGTRWDLKKSRIFRPVRA
jgi:hypothetical protein